MIKTIDPYILPIYDNMRFCVIDSDSKSEVKKYLNKNKIYNEWVDDPYAGTISTTILVNKINKAIIVVIIDSSDEDMTPSVIAHEALHCCHYVFKHIEQRLVYNHESQNYLLEYFFNKISELTNKSNN